MNDDIDRIYEEILVGLIMKNHVKTMVDLQRSLVVEFFNIYPSLKDFDLLLDFPKTGEIKLENTLWNFIKHGKGLKFIRKEPKPNIIIDVHINILDPCIVDEWRLSQYLESLGYDLQKYNMRAILDEMVMFEVLESMQLYYRFKNKENL